MTSLYTYTPLRTRGAIRVIELLPGGHDDPIIHINIRRTNLEAAKNTFDAISYTWGADNRCKKISCGQDLAQLDVTINCYTALLYLRHTNKPRTIWIDAICINQSDISERNFQVWIMGDIFAAARQAVVFLGESTRGTETLFRHLTNVDNCITAGGSYDDIPIPKETIVRELGLLLKRDWFSRVWVIQELVRSESAVFMCGSDVTTYLTLKKCLYGYSNTLVVNFLPAPFDILEGGHLRFLEIENPTLMQVMYLLFTTTSLCEATDPRDRILALTPLIESRDPTLKTLVDYNKTVEALFVEFSLNLLSETGLAILRLIHHPHSKAIPSWSPDWSQQVDHTFANIDANHYFHDSIGLNIHQNYTLSDADLSYEGRVNSLQLLNVRGIRYSYVEFSGPPIEFHNGDFAVLKKLVKNLFSTMGMLRQGKNLQGWPDSIVTAIQNLDQPSLYNLLLRHLVDVKHFGEGNPEIISRMVESCDGCLIFVTTDGKLGLGPREVETGDLVCLIRGALQPCLLRERNDGTWAIVSGDCFVLELYQDTAASDYDMFKHLENITHESTEGFCIK